MDKETSTLLSLSETQSGSALGDATQVSSGEGTAGLFQTANIICSLENKPGNRRSLSLGRNHTGREPGVGGMVRQFFCRQKLLIMEAIWAKRLSSHWT